MQNARELKPHLINLYKASSCKTGALINAKWNVSQICWIYFTWGTLRKRLDRKSLFKTKTKKSVPFKVDQSGFSLPVEPVSSSSRLLFGARGETTCVSLPCGEPRCQSQIAVVKNIFPTKKSLQYHYLFVFWCKNMIYFWSSFPSQACSLFFFLFFVFFSVFLRAAYSSCFLLLSKDADQFLNDQTTLKRLRFELFKMDVQDFRLELSGTQPRGKDNQQNPTTKPKLPQISWLWYLSNILHNITN